MLVSSENLKAIAERFPIVFPFDHILVKETFETKQDKGRV